VSASRVGLALIVVALTWVGEEFPSIDPRPWWYQRDFLGVPLHYPLLAGVLLILAPILLRTPVFPFSRALRVAKLWRWSVAALVAVVLSLIVGLLRQSGELFADWRNLAVLALVAAVSARWLAAQPWRRWVITDMAIAYGAMSSLSLANWIVGGGTVTFGVRVPNWYFNNLSLAAFAAIVATEFWVNHQQGAARPYRLALGGAALASTLVVFLSFRRSLWLLLVAGLCIVGWMAFRRGSLSPRKLLAATVLGSLVVAILLLSIGSEALAERISSINPTSDNRVAATNADHLGDIADAWDVIMTNPISGLGVGSYYETSRIVGWKTRSFEVHNAMLQSWLKFGLLGLIVYIGFNVRWIMAFLKAGRVGWLAGSVGAGIYLIADQVPALMQTWAYGSVQLSVHRGILLAALLVAVMEKHAPAWSSTASAPAWSEDPRAVAPSGSPGL
jgi:hypothetical protein